MQDAVPWKRDVILILCHMWHVATMEPSNHDGNGNATFCQRHYVILSLITVVNNTPL